MLRFTCRYCGCRDYRLIPVVGGILPRLLRKFGMELVRCRECAQPSWSSLWGLRQLHLARCPSCYRTELTTWSEKYHRTTAWQAWRLALGAKRVRCAACRCNFVSFRKVASPARGVPSGLDQRMAG
ncbi:MAG: hypothetical protein SFV18_22255 [Bryobacteraceae bacterium]|nr:hypothetical protein [Bryobacteraceae bacterium]